MTPAEVALFEQLMQANAAADAVPDDEAPGYMAAGLIAAALPRVLGEVAARRQHENAAPNPSAQ